MSVVLLLFSEFSDVFPAYCNSCVRYTGRHYPILLTRWKLWWRNLFTIHIPNTCQNWLGCSNSSFWSDLHLTVDFCKTVFMLFVCSLKLQTMRCLFEAYEHVLSLLENVFTPMFCHSDEVSQNINVVWRFFFKTY